MLSEKDKKSLQLLLVFGVIAVLGMYVHVRTNVRPQLVGLQESIDKGRVTLKERQMELAELAKWEGREGEIRAMVMRLQKKMERIPTRIDPRKFVGILRDCILIASLSDIAVMQLKPNDMGLYQEVPYEIICRARYHDLGQFLMLVEQHAQQILRVKTMNITNDPKRPSRHPVTLRLSTFVIKAPMPTVPPAAAKEVASK